MKVEALTDLSGICPYGLKESKCAHCLPDKAPCVKACPKGAIYEIAEGILAIDHEICNGCGECVKACPYGAIEIVNGASAKCDLCLKMFEEPQCVLTGLAKIVYSEEEKSRIREAVGWGVLDEGEYSVNIPSISLTEAALFREIVERYAKLKGEFSWEEVLNGIEYEMGEISEDMKKRIMWWIRVTYEQYGPLTFLDDPEIEEISVVRLKEPIRVYVRGRGWLKTDLAFWREDYFVYVVNKFAAQIGRRVTLKNPRVNAILPDGSRLHAVLPPISMEGHTLTIRRFAARRMTPLDIILSGTATWEQMAELWLAMDSEMNVIIAGNTGSGKTTTLNALLAFVPLEERIILVEETPEIKIPHPHTVRLVPTEEISMQELVYDTLRMRPDRIVVGEVRRHEEMRALFDTMLAGQGKGSYATMHGRTAEEAIKRIKSMGIPEEDIEALDVLVIQKRRAKRRGGEERRITEIVWRRKPEEFEKEIHERIAALKTFNGKNLEEFAWEVERWRASR